MTRVQRVLWASYRNATGTTDFNIAFPWELQSPLKSMLKAGVNAIRNATSSWR